MLSSATNPTDRAAKIKKAMKHRRDHAREVMARLVRRKMSKPVKYAWLAAAVILLAGFAPFTLGKTRNELAEASSGSLIQEAVVKSLKATAIGSAFPGMIRSIDVRPGQKVRKGDTLLVMHTEPLVAQETAFKSQLATENASLLELQAQRAAEVRELDQQIAAVRQMRSSQSILVHAEPDGMDPDGAIFAEPGREMIEDASPVSPDRSAELQQLDAELAALQTRRQEIDASYQPGLSDQRQRVAEASERLNGVRRLLAQAVRKAPFNGIVTAVERQAKTGVGAGEPVVRLDDPESYRVVTRVPLEVKDRLKLGAFIPVVVQDSERPARITKISGGWDREALKYWIYADPIDKEGLSPGQKVKIKLPRKMQLSEKSLESAP